MYLPDSMEAYLWGFAFDTNMSESENLNITQSNQKNPFLDSLNWKDTVLIVCFCLIFVVGVTGNLLVCYVFKIRAKAPLSVMETLICYLALFDLLSSIINPAMYIYWTVTYRERWHFGLAGCIILSSSTRIFLNMSFGIIIIIALDRYFLIVKPFGIQFTQKTVRLLVGIVLAASILMDLPYILFKQVNSKYNCRVPPNTGEKFIYPRAITLLLRDVAFACILGITVYCIRKVLYDKERNETLQQMGQVMRYRKIVHLLETIAVMFMFLVFPHDLFHVIYMFSQLHPPRIPYTVTVLHINSALKILHMANSVVNVFIYAKLHSQFRHTLKNWCSAKKKNFELPGEDPEVKNQEENQL